MSSIYDQQRAELEKAYANFSPKSGYKFLGIAIVGGIMGLHRFYVGKFGSGLLYMFTLGGFFIGWILDIIKIVTGKFTDSKGRIVAVDPDAGYRRELDKIELEELKAKKKMMELENENK